MRLGQYRPSPGLAGLRKPSREMAYEGALLPILGLNDPPHSVSSLPERRLAMALLETTYMDLQRPARLRLWDMAMDFVNGAYPKEAAQFKHMCETLNLDEVWLKHKLKQVARWPEERPPLSGRQRRRIARRRA